jgi:DNA repair photolyase
MTTTPELNEDGISVRGCKIIYAPRGQAGEYSVLATSPFIGCGHGCRYCYVPRVMHMNSTEARRFHALATPRNDYLGRLTADARKYQQLGVTEQVMFSFTTDPYNPADAEPALTRKAIQVLQNHGLAFCTLTKGGSRALRDLDLFRPHRDAFATTLTSIDPDFSTTWEPDAADPADRIITLERFHDAGIFTWVSLEPVLDTRHTLEVIRVTHPFVDFYKIGKANYIPQAKQVDWQQFTWDVVALCNQLGANHYIKQDLQPYLPAGYPNPLRIPQHR